MPDANNAVVVPRFGSAYLPRLFASCCVSDMSLSGSVEYVCIMILRAAVHVAPVRETDILRLHDSDDHRHAIAHIDSCTLHLVWLNNTALPLAADLTPSMAPCGKTASDPLPANMLAPSTAGTSFPFAAAFPGKHVEIDLPKPSKFSRIAVGSDIRAWLLRMHEYLSISGIETSVWVVFASNFLDQAPLQLWEARKTQLSQRPEVLYSWDNFREWCVCSFSVHNHERRALSQLGQLHQTGSVAEYKAAHDVLAAHTNLPMQLRILWWERGLKDEIRTMCLVDPFTHREYIDMEKAQFAACVCDAHLGSVTDNIASDDHDIPVTKRPRESTLKVINAVAIIVAALVRYVTKACINKDELQDGVRYFWNRSLNSSE